MGLTEAVKSCLSKYATFSGRARRSEYWFFSLAVFLAASALDVIAILLNNDATPYISFIVTAAAVIPSLAVTVRRLHDISRSGWWVLIGCIPIVGFILMLVWTTTDSYPAPNEYGENPKA